MHRSVALCGVTLMVAACADPSTIQLGGGDARGPDAARSDTSPADARVEPDAAVDGGPDASFDAGSDGGVDGAVDAGGPAACAEPLVQPSLHRETTDGRPNFLTSFSGPSTVVQISPNQVRFTADEDAFFIFDPGGDVTPSLRLGERVRIELEVQQNFWGPHWQLEVSARGGGIILASWRTSSLDPIRLPSDLVVRAQPGRCAAPDLGCGPREGVDLAIEGPATRIVIPSGERGSVGGFAIWDGGSYVYARPPGCTDIPSRETIGFLQIPSRLDRCTALSRDRCIESPDCALHGSQNDDPGYVCQPVALRCEALDSLGCERVDVCQWDPGACYCPEGADCLCEGGAAPICRQRCDTATDFILCDGRPDYFCEIPPSDVGVGCSSGTVGACQRIPQTCAGTPASAEAVCACPEVAPDPGPMSFENDCLRRRSAASQVPPAACAP